jgi:hypothetical protein
MASSSSLGLTRLVCVKDPVRYIFPFTFAK